MRVTHDGEDRQVVAYTGKDYGQGGDWLELIPILEEGYSYNYISAELWKEGVKQNSTSDTDYVILDENRIYLGPEAKPGDIINIKAIVEIDYEGYKDSRLYEKQINVVDLVINSISVKGLNPDGNLTMTVSASKQLKVEIDGYGTDEAIENAELIIARRVSEDRDISYYWQVKTPSTGNQFVNIESTSARSDLPFVVQKVILTNNVTKDAVDSTYLGANATKGKQEFSSCSRVFVLEGSTTSGIAEVRLAISYVYSPAGNYENNPGQIIFVPNSYGALFTEEAYFKVIVTEDSNEDHPTPIYDEAGLLKMAASSSGDYILMNDITIKNHTALDAKFNSFDGNNKIITIESFNYKTDLASSNSNYAINLGLFDTISSNTIIKNVIVALPADKLTGMNLKSYTTINFGGIAAINEGIITNCDVISVEPSTQLSPRIEPYTINIETAVSISGKEVVANIGGLVAINNSTGFITNSRVGRETVEILKVYGSESTVVYKDIYDKTKDTTLIRVYGRANVGGFVSENKGSISTSYAKNIQLEVISESYTGFVKTGGFVVTNNGFIYGSYVAGWEEEAKNPSSLGTSSNRKLGGGILSNGFIGGFVYANQGYIEDAYSNINVSGDLTFASKTPYVNYLLGLDDVNQWTCPAVGGFVYISTARSYIYTSYSLSKINNSKLNTHGAFEGRESANDDFANDGEVINCYFMIEKSENFTYEHERARMLSDNPSIDLDSSENVVGTNEFINKDSFNNFSFDNSIVDFRQYDGQSMGGVWAIYKVSGTYGYPELISANTIAISCRVINVTKTNNSETNTYYYTYADGYEAGSYLNPYIVANFEQYNNIFKDTVGGNSFNEDITTKFTGNIRLVKNINFNNNEEVYSTSVEFTSLTNMTSIFDGNYLVMYNVKLSDKSSGKSSFGLFRDIYYAAVKNLTISVTSVNAGNTTSVGVLAGVIVNSNISNVSLVASTASTGVVIGNNYVGALAGIVTSSNAENLYTISDIQSNLAIVGSTSSNNEIVSALTSSFIIWEKIKPTANSSGLSEVNNNLRLHHLPNNVYYAGGVAGVVDLHQLSEVEDDNDIKDANAYNIHVGSIIPNNILSTAYINYERVVSVISDFAGGLFGFVGAETLVDRGEFIAVGENEEHFISANEAAGGITAVNFGKINESYVSFDKETVIALDKDIVDYVNQNANAKIQINNTLFSSGTPKYVGGIVGINTGNRTGAGTGNITHCYNRVNVKNTSAKGVGGIVGGTYIGQISNVYTTASLMGDLSTPEETKIGAIVGKIFENGDEGYFADYYLSGNENDYLSIFNVVAVNMWDTEDFDSLYRFVNINGGAVGALYGRYKMKVNKDGDPFVKISNAATDYIFVQSYVLKDYSSAGFSDLGVDEFFKIEDYLTSNLYFELWGATSSIDCVDDFLSGKLGVISIGQNGEVDVNTENNINIICPNDLRALFSKTEYGVSTLRSTYFPSTKWPRSIWNYDQENLLPILDYGYESSVIRIYTAPQFFEKLSEGNSSGKMYVIMNDIDFGGYQSITPIIARFRGRLIGNDVTYTTEGGVTYTRKPILFNLNYDNTLTEDKNNDGTEELVYTDSIFALFKETIGANFSDFSVVISKFNTKFDYSLHSSTTMASALVGKAQNTTFNNVHIYDSLDSLVDKDCLVGNGYVLEDSVLKANVEVTHGLYFNETSQTYYSLSTPFIKLATLNNMQNGESFSNQYIFFKESSNYVLNIIKEIPEGSLSYVEYKKQSSGRYICVTDNSKERTGLTTEEKILTIHACTSPIVVENANFVGMLMGDSSFGFVKAVSINLKNSFNVSYNSQTAGQALIYIGGLIGKSTSEIDVVVNSSNLNVTQNLSSSNSNVTLYLGGVIGNLQGRISNAHTKNSSINVGTTSSYFEVASGGAGAFVGGIAGSVDKYTALNEASVGGASYLYSLNSSITTYIQGSTYIGGVMGQNSYASNDMYNRVSKGVSGKAITANVNDTETAIVVGGIIGSQKASEVANMFNAVSTFVNVGNNGFNEIYLGGIIGQSAHQDTTINNSINDAEKLQVNSNGVNVKNSPIYIGGIIAGFNSENKDITLNNSMSFANIISDQHNSMYVGGAVGKARKLTANNVIILGNITLNRCSGYNGKLFLSGEHSIGGLIGSVENYTQTDSTLFKGVLVLSTIRDYAMAQKTNYNIGPVIGTDRARNSYDSDGKVVEEAINSIGFNFEPSTYEPSVISLGLEFNVK